MADGPLRGVINQSRRAVILMASAGVASFLGCAPSSGAGKSEPPIGTSIPGGHAGVPGGGQGGGGAPPNGGAPPSGASGLPQGGIIGAGGIVPQGGTGNGGFDPGGGGSFGGSPTGGFFSNSGGIPIGAGGTCGMNENDPSQYPACSTCTGGRCVPTDQLTGAPVQLLAACDPTNACVPEQIVAQGSNLLLRGCTSIGGSEGRCTSLCIPAASNLSAYLPQDVCASTERCVPCYSPNDGSNLGICGLGCDPGPTGQPYIFGTCCGGAGRCAPKSALPPDTAKNLGQETCQSGNLCVPGAPIADPAYRFPCCTTNGISGICAPACVIEQTTLGKSLNQGDCASGNDDCVPCKNPLTNAPTGACSDRNGQVTSACVP